MALARAVALGLWEAWNQDKPERMAAALAFYSLFSFVPLLYIALVIAGLFLNDVATRREVLFQLQKAVGSDTAAFVQELVLKVGEQQATQSLLVSLASLGVLLYVASGLFATLEDMLNILWQNPFSKTHGLFAIIRAQFLAFLLVIGVGLFFVLLTASSFLVSLLGSALRLDVGLLVLNDILTFSLTVFAFAVLYRLLARTPAAWRDIVLAAFVAGVLFSLGKWGFGLYLQFSNLSSAFGAASALAVLLLGIYYSALIFLVSAVLIRILPSARQAQEKI